MFYTQPHLLESSNFSREYPYLARSAEHLYIVLFTAKNTGTVVDAAGCPNVSMGELGGCTIDENGEKFEGFNEKSFAPLQMGEHITLSNFPLE